MNILKLLFLASTMFITSCIWPFLEEPEELKQDRHFTITNNSEYNITRVIIIYYYGEIENIVDKKDNELIAKNGGSKIFNMGKIPIGSWEKCIACVEAEDTSEPMCTLYRCDATWNGNDSSDWLPAASFYECPSLFAQFVQCRREVKDE
jgi:hypothetical protein